MKGNRILSFEDFVAGGHDHKMGGAEPHMGMEMPSMHAELPAHEPMDMDAELAMIDEPEMHSEHEGFGMEEGSEE